MEDIRKDIRKAISIVTLWSFLLSTIAWATESPLGSTNVFLNRTGSPGVFKELNPETFQLPEYLGSIRAVHTADSNKTVIHIQDAHCNYYAQHKINGIIEYLNREYGIDAVNLEGGKGEYDLSIFTRIRENDIREKVADYFVKEGIVNGAEYFAINNPGKTTLWGIENTELYLENLNLYRDTLKHKKTIDKHLKTLNRIFSNLKLHIYSKELLEFDKKYNQYKAHSLELKSYLIHLAEMAKEKEIDIAEFTNLNLLHKSLAQEDTIDFRAANAQRNALIDKFQKMLSRKSLEELTRKAVEHKTDKLSQHAFYSYLFEKARIINLDLTPYPELKKYTSYISAYNAIDKFQIMREIDELDEKIRQTLYNNDTQRQLSLLCKNLILVENMLSLSITKEDYEYYTSNKDSFSIQNFISFIEKEAPLYKITARPDENIIELNDHLENMAECYSCTFKRDQAFIKNMNLKNAAIVITGGFHSENLQELCKKKNISYISIMPNFKTKNGYECPYFRLIGGSGPRSEALEAIASQLHGMQVQSPFAANALQVLGESNLAEIEARIILREQLEQKQNHKLALITERDEDGIFVYEIDSATQEITLEGKYKDESKLTAGVDIMHITELIDLAQDEFTDKPMAMEGESFEPIRDTHADTLGRAIETLLPLLNIIDSSGALVRELTNLRNGEAYHSDDTTPDGSKIPITIQFSTGLNSTDRDEHVGGYGISIREEHRNSEDLIWYIIHGALAGILANHERNVEPIEQALREGRQEDAERLVGKAIERGEVYDKFLWQMTKAQRAKLKGRDVATTMRDDQPYNVTPILHAEDISGAISVFEKILTHAANEFLGKYRRQLSEPSIKIYESLINRLSKPLNTTSDTGEMAKFYSDMHRCQSMFIDDYNIHNGVANAVEALEIVLRKFCEIRFVHVQIGQRIDSLIPLPELGGDSCEIAEMIETIPGSEGDKSRIAEVIALPYFVEGELKMGHVVTGFVEEVATGAKTASDTQQIFRKFNINVDRQTTKGRLIINHLTPVFNAVDTMKPSNDDERRLRNSVTILCQDINLADSDIDNIEFAKVLMGTLGIFFWHREEQIAKPPYEKLKEAIEAVSGGTVIDNLTGERFDPKRMECVKSEAQNAGTPIVIDQTTAGLQTIRTHRRTRKGLVPLDKPKPVNIVTPKVAIGPAAGRRRAIGELGRGAVLTRGRQGGESEDSLLQKFGIDIQTDTIKGKLVVKHIMPVLQAIDSMKPGNFAEKEIPGKLRDRLTADINSADENIADVKFAKELMMTLNIAFAHRKKKMVTETYMALITAIETISGGTVVVGLEGKAYDSLTMKTTTSDASMLNVVERQITPGLTVKDFQSRTAMLGTEILVYPVVSVARRGPTLNEGGPGFPIILKRAGETANYGEAIAYVRKAWEERDVNQTARAHWEELAGNFERASRGDTRLKSEWSFLLETIRDTDSGLHEAITAEFQTEITEPQKRIIAAIQNELAEVQKDCKTAESEQSAAHKVLKDVFGELRADIEHIKNRLKLDVEQCRNEVLTKHLPKIYDDAADAEIKKRIGEIVQLSDEAVACLGRLSTEMESLPDSVDTAQKTMQRIKSELENVRSHVKTIEANVDSINTLLQSKMEEPFMLHTINSLKDINSWIDRANTVSLSHWQMQRDKAEKLHGRISDMEMEIERIRAVAGFTLPEEMEINPDRLTKVAEALERVSGVVSFGPHYLADLQSGGWDNDSLNVLGEYSNPERIDVIVARLRILNNVDLLSRYRYLSEDLIYLKELRKRFDILVDKGFVSAGLLARTNVQLDSTMADLRNILQTEGGVIHSMTERVDMLLARLNRASVNAEGIVITAEATVQQLCGNDIADSMKTVQEAYEKCQGAIVYHEKEKQKTELTSLGDFFTNLTTAFNKAKGLQPLLPQLTPCVASLESAIKTLRPIHDSLQAVDACRGALETLEQSRDQAESFIAGLRAKFQNIGAAFIEKQEEIQLTWEGFSWRVKTESQVGLKASGEQLANYHIYLGAIKGKISIIEQKLNSLLDRMQNVANGNVVIEAGKQNSESDLNALITDLNELADFSNSLNSLYLEGVEPFFLQHHLGQITYILTAMRDLRSALEAIDSGAYKTANNDIATLSAKIAEKEKEFAQAESAFDALTRRQEGEKRREAETRQAQTVEALLSDDRKTDVVKTIVGIPADMNPTKVQQALRKINRGLARNGFGNRGDTHQVTTYEIDTSDPEKTRQNYEKAVEKAQEELPAKGRIVLFAPQMDRGPQLAGQAQAQYKGDGHITVIPDTYSDAHPDQAKYPDLNVRTALARHVAFYYNGNDTKSALDSINNLLRQISENAIISSIEQLLNILNPLRIRPVIFESLKHWQESQEATATSL